MAEIVIPSKIKCPSCSIESDTIKVRQQNILCWNGRKWEWGDPSNDYLGYYCDECGEELPDTDELQLIVESAVCY